MRFAVLAAFGGLALLAAPVLADTQNRVLVELYTSQGCSSCPPADDVLGRLAGDANVIPLSLHVDYWDYLGWKDKFSDAKFTGRQRAYAAAAHDNMIYTPQMIINGTARVVGSRKVEVERAIAKAGAGPSPVALSADRTGANVTIHAKTTGPTTGPMDVQIVRYSPSEEVKIKGGENSGLTITYHNVVTSWQRIGTWSGAEPLALNASVPGSDGVVVVIQATGAGRVLAAAQLR